MLWIAPADVWTDRLSSAGFNNCLLVGRITIRVNGMTEPSRTSATAHQNVAPASHAATEETSPTAAKIACSTATNSANLTQHLILAFARCIQTPESTQAQTLERGASRSSTDVRHNDQFKNRDIGDFNSIFLDLAYCVKWAEIPLLAHNFSK